MTRDNRETDKNWWERRVRPFLPDDTIEWEELTAEEKQEIKILRQRVERENH